MNNRFHERLATGPIVVGDGGMGVLISSAVPRLRCPEEANIRSPEASSPCTQASSAPAPT